MPQDKDPRDSVINSLLAYDARISSGFLAVSILIVFILAITIQYIGAIFACILSFVFFGGFVGGSLFPQAGLDQVLGSRPDFAKLLVWAFIAGFAQRFVPQILSSLIKRSTKSDENLGEDREAQTGRERE
jgi:hypothetical protein